MVPKIVFIQCFFVETEVTTSTLFSVVEVVKGGLLLRCFPVHVCHMLDAIYLEKYLVDYY